MININDLTIEAAKAMAFDTMVRIEQEQRNLQMLNQIISQRVREQDMAIEPAVEKKKAKSV